MWSILQQWQLQQVRKDLQNVELESRQSKRAAGTSTEKVEQLSLAMEAMWSLMKDRLGLDDEDLLQRMDELDMRDGVRDGKLKPAVLTCLGCGRKINTKTRKCIYCGIENEQYSPF